MSYHVIFSFLFHPKKPPVNSSTLFDKTENYCSFSIACVFQFNCSRICNDDEIQSYICSLLLYTHTASSCIKIHGNNLGKITYCCRVCVLFVFCAWAFHKKKGLTNFPVSTTWFTVAEMQWFPFLQKKDQQTRYTVNHNQVFIIVFNLH